MLVKCLFVANNKEDKTRRKRKYTTNGGECSNISCFVII